MTALDALRTLDGVRRAWPGATGGLTFEQVDAHGYLRAGRILATGEIELLPYRTDPALPSLGVHATESSDARRAAKGAHHSSDSGRPESHGTKGELLVHRAGRRAVERLGHRYRKHLRAKKAWRVADTTRAVAPTAVHVGINIPSVLDAGDAYVDFAAAPGRPVFSNQCLPGAWEVLTQRWPTFAYGPALDLPEYRGTDEARTLLTWIGHAQDHHALAAIEALADAAQAIGQRLSETDGRLVNSHRDLHDGQLLWDGDVLTVLDVDTAARAEAALDLGNLAAHLEWAQVCTAAPAAHAAQAGPAAASGLEAIARLAEQMRIDPTRLETYTQAARLRIACVHAFRPCSWPYLDQWVEVCLSH